MIVGWFMRRVVFPLAFWRQMRKARDRAFEGAADELGDDLTPVDPVVCGSKLGSIPALCVDCASKDGPLSGCGESINRFVLGDPRPPSAA